MSFSIFFMLASLAWGWLCTQWFGFDERGTKQLRNTTIFFTPVVFILFGSPFLHQLSLFSSHVEFQTLNAIMLIFMLTVGQFTPQRCVAYQGHEEAAYYEELKEWKEEQEAEKKEKEEGEHLTKNEHHHKHNYGATGLSI